MLNYFKKDKKLVKEDGEFKIFEKTKQFISYKPIEIVEIKEYYVEQTIKILCFSFGIYKGFRCMHGIIEPFPKLEEAELYVEKLKELKKLKSRN